MSFRYNNTTLNKMEEKQQDIGHSKEVTKTTDLKRTTTKENDKQLDDISPTSVKP